jgi:hypothetical protein
MKRPVPIFQLIGPIELAIDGAASTRTSHSVCRAILVLVDQFNGR